MTVAYPTPVSTLTTNSAGYQAMALLGWLGLCFSASITSSFVSADGWYESIPKPGWSPPAWIFGSACTFLYAIMAMAVWLVWQEGGWRAQRRPLSLFLLLWLLNVLWMPLFFGVRLPGLAFLEIIVLWLVLVATVDSFWQTTKVAGFLMMFYLAWVSFAASLNFAIWRLHP